MVTPNENPETLSTANPATELALRLGPDDGTDPAASDETEDFQLLTVTRTAGGRLVDQATLAVDLGKTGDRLVDLETPTKWSRQLEIRLPDEDDPELTSELLYWGELSSQRINVGQGEGAIVTAGTERYHFGEPLVGFPVYDPLDEAVDTLQRDPVFNPLIDGIIEGNLSSRTDDGDNGETLRRFLDPESARTTAATDYQEATAEEWDLAAAVETVCQICNEDEEFIKNPSTEILADAPDPKNLRLRRGRYLPEYLDALLHPVGFDWFVAHSLEGEDRVSEITIFEIGEGIRQPVRFQAPGETLDLAAQNVADLELETSIAELANLVHAFGSLKQYEVTVPLYRAWPDSGDAKTSGQLAKTNFDKTVNETYTDNPAAWRLFEGNEAGDLIGLRTDSPTAPPDFAGEIGTTWIPARQPLGPTLTLDPRGKRQKPWLEYSVDAGATWLPWDEADPDLGRYLVLADRIGVLFDRQEPPAKLIAGGDDAQLRITGTLTVDARLEKLGSRRPTSPNARDVTIVYDLSDRFHFRQVEDLGTFASTMTGSATDEVDDTTKIGDWLDDLQDVHQAAGMNGSFQLHGLHFNYQIGDVIDEVDGRGISLNRNAEGASEKKYLQLTGITWDYQRQETTLHVQAVERR